VATSIAKHRDLDINVGMLYLCHRPSAWPACCSAVASTISSLLGGVRAGARMSAMTGLPSQIGVLMLAGTEPCSDRRGPGRGLEW
jgi:hypothetical protein